MNEILIDRELLERAVERLEYHAGCLRGGVCAELRAALAAPQQEPTDGYALVPVEPTEVMRKAGESERLRNPTNINPYQVYKAMLAAAPSTKGETK